VNEARRRGLQSLRESGHIDHTATPLVEIGSDEFGWAGVVEAGRRGTYVLCHSLEERPRVYVTAMAAFSSGPALIAVDGSGPAVVAGTAPSLSVVRITCAPGVRATSRTSAWVWLLGVDALGHEAVEVQVVDAAGVSPAAARLRSS